MRDREQLYCASRGSTNIHAANCTIYDIARYNATNLEFLDIRRHEKHTLFYPLEDIIVPWKDRFMSSNTT